MFSPVTNSRSSLATQVSSYSDHNDFDIIDIFAFSNETEILYSDFIKKMKNHFGESLIHNLEGTYKPSSTISVLEIKKRIISVAALIKKDDLENLFNEIHGQNINLGCLDLLTTEEKEAILEVSRFDKLNDRQLEILTSVFRYFPNEESDRQAVGSLFFPLKQFPKVPNQDKVFYKHLTMIRAFERTDHFIQDKNRKSAAVRQRFASSEHLCREIAYGIPLNSDSEKKINQKNLGPQRFKEAMEDLIKQEIVGTIFPCLNEKGDKIFYEIRSSVFENGLVAFFCAPLTTGQWQKKSSTPCPMKAIFRGTWCLSSLKRDIESLEAGKNSFFGFSPEIIERLGESIPDEVDSVRLDVLGHSLGGVDASRLVALLAQIRVERQRELGEDHKSKLDVIREVNLTTWNAPGVLKRTCISYNQSVAELAKNPILPMKFKHLHIKVGEDVFQNFGRSLLGWIDPRVAKQSKKSIHNPNTRVVKFNFKDFHTILGTTWFAHRLPCLSIDAKPTRMRISKGKMNYKLGPRSIFSWIKMIAKAIFRRAKRVPRVLFRLCKRLIKKEMQKDHHKLYHLLAIRQVCVPT